MRTAYTWLFVLLSLTGSGWVLLGVRDVYVFVLATSGFHLLIGAFGAMAYKPEVRHQVITQAEELSRELIELKKAKMALERELLFKDVELRKATARLGV